MTIQEVSTMTMRDARTVSNDSAVPPKCTAIRVIGARGSTEPQAGSRLLEPIGDALARTLPGHVTYDELTYPATIERFVPPADIDLGESPAVGVTNLIAHLNETARREPASCFVLLGYSQGAQVVGDALLSPSQRMCGHHAGEIEEAASDRVLAIALFGDPRFTKGDSFNAGTFDSGREGLWPRPAGALDRFAGRMRNYCARDDVTCQGAGGNLQAHTGYFSNTMPAEAVSFATQLIGSHRCLT